MPKALSDNVLPVQLARMMKQQGKAGGGGEAHRLSVGLAVPGKVGDDVDEDAPRSAQQEGRQLQHQGREPPHAYTSAAPQLVIPMLEVVPHPL